MKSMLRSSIYYACETYYDLKETEIRKLERIEETFLRKILKTSSGCPINQLYLEVGLTPGRFEIIKTRLLYLRYILNQKKESRLFKFFEAQKNNPRKGDWVSMCRQNMKEIHLKISMKEIKEMKETRFRSLLKEKIRIAALEYLKENRKTKGKEIDYRSLHMADYLLPNSSELTISEKQEIFAMRNRMTNIPANFSSMKETMKCVCGLTEQMAHIYECIYLNKEKITMKYENVEDMKIVLKDLNKKWKKERKFKI